jgi:hypothetical protein
MSLRTILLTLVIVATGAFIAGTAIERNSGESRHEQTATRSESGEGTGEGGEEGETPEQHSAEGKTSSSAESGEELKPLGIDIEAAPFVALAAIVSVGLAIAVWRRPRVLPLLAAFAAVMVVFAVLDVREVFHQANENRTGLVILAALVAVLHLAAAAVAGLLGRSEQRATTSICPSRTRCCVSDAVPPRHAPNLY